MKKTAAALFACILMIPELVFAEQITITVKGMVCSFCAQGIKKSFAKNAKIKAVEVDLDHKLVKLETVDGSALSNEEISEIVNDAGYDVLKIERAQHA